ncbi:DNA-binding protein [Coemansia spiralis]|nr:DNA-binding protein [Coemansia spiralis]
MLSTKSNAASDAASSISKVDAICDFLEVYIHAVLHNRSVYPKSLFEDRYAYGIPVKASRHPELNQYIADVLAAIRSELLKSSEPGDVMIDIVDGNGSTLEAFVLELSVISGNYDPRHDIELRATLIRTNMLEPANVPEDVSFSVCYRPRNGKPPSLEKNMWVSRLENTKIKHSHEPRLVPLSSIDSADLKIQAFALLRMDQLSKSEHSI